MITVIEKQNFDEERALYGSRDVTVRECNFDGSADGESAFKESRGIVAENCFYNLRYPFWHVCGLKITGGRMTELCRAALWYSRDVEIQGLEMHGIKALRECENVSVKDCDVVSPEFGWSVHGLKMENVTASGEYFLMRSTEIRLNRVKLKGKYSFQYVENVTVENCDLETKDAFWHAKNVTVKNCTVKGEYLAWYSENLTLEGCKIIGTQPFCYCKGLRLIDCEMYDADLCFERSEVYATVVTQITSIKNPYRGEITAPSVGEIIADDVNARCKINIKKG